MADIVLGIDQAELGGIAISESEDKLKLCQNFNLGAFYSRSQGRLFYGSLVSSFVYTHKPTVIIIERVRLFSFGRINMDVIKRLTGLIYLTIDNANKIPVYSIDTRSWKKAVLGSGKATKQDAIDYVKNKWDLTVDDNVADAICISQSWYKSDRKMFKLEA